MNGNFEDHRQSIGVRIKIEIISSAVGMFQWDVNIINFLQSNRNETIMEKKKGMVRYIFEKLFDRMIRLRSNQLRRYHV